MRITGYCYHICHYFWIASAMQLGSVVGEGIM